MQEQAIAKLRRRKQRDEGTTGLEKKKAYTLKEWTYRTLREKKEGFLNFGKLISEGPYFRRVNIFGISPDKSPKDFVFDNS